MYRTAVHKKELLSQNINSIKVKELLLSICFQHLSNTIKLIPCVIFKTYRNVYTRQWIYVPTTGLNKKCSIPPSLLLTASLVFKVKIPIMLLLYYNYVKICHNMLAISYYVKLYYNYPMTLINLMISHIYALHRGSRIIIGHYKNHMVSKYLFLVYRLSWLIPEYTTGKKWFYR